MNGYVHMEKIKCAALRFYLEPSGEEVIVVGMNHANCFMMAHEQYQLQFHDRNKERDTQGFMTTTDRFVDRSEALEIAKKNNQLKYKIPEYKTWLDSYEVNFVIE